MKSEFCVQLKLRSFNNISAYLMSFLLYIP